MGDSLFTEDVIRIDCSDTSHETIEDMVNVRGTAYTGGIMNINGVPTVMVLDGMKIGGVPLLVDHQNTVHCKVGHANTTREGFDIKIEGKIATKTDIGKTVYSLMKISPFQLSGGWAFSSKNAHLSKQGEVVNGNVLQAGVRVIDKSVLNEVSFVPLGADRDTQALLASYKQPLEGSEIMEGKDVIGNSSIVAAEEQVKPPDGVVNKTADEVKPSVSNMEVPRLLAKFGKSDLIVQALEESWSKEKALEMVEQGLEKYVAAAKHANIPTAAEIKVPNVALHIPKSEDMLNDKVLEASFCIQSGVSEEALRKTYTEEQIDKGARSRMGLKETVYQYALKNGYYGAMNDNDMIKAAFSTQNLVWVFENVANKNLLDAYNLVDESNIVGRLTRDVSVRDFRPRSMYRLTTLGEFEEIPDSGSIPHGTFGESKAEMRISTFGKMFAITRKTIIDDDMSVFTQLPRDLGVMAKNNIINMFFKKLLNLPTTPMEPGSSTMFISGTNNNLFTGGTSDLSVEGLQHAITQFKIQQDEWGKPLILNPTYLLIPPELEFKAREIFNSNFLLPATGNTRKFPTANVLQGYGLTVLISPYLSNPALGSGASKTAWYLFADPSSAAASIYMGWLDGRKAPYIEQEPAPFHTLGVQYRAYMDVGIQEIDFRGVSKSLGA